MFSYPEMSRIEIIGCVIQQRSQDLCMGIGPCHVAARKHSVVMVEVHTGRSCFTLRSMVMAFRKLCCCFGLYRDKIDGMPSMRALSLFNQAMGPLFYPDVARYICVYPPPRVGTVLLRELLPIGSF